LLTNKGVILRGTLLVAQSFEALRYKSEVMASIPDGVTVIFH
jgi:hypothetical protein